MTLVFVKEKSEEGVREALDNRRTLAYFYGNVAGEERWLKSLFLASVQWEKVSERGKSISYRVMNLSGIQYKFSIDAAEYILDGGASIQISLPAGKREVSMLVLNMHCYEGMHPEVSMVL